VWKLLQNNKTPKTLFLRKKYLSLSNVDCIQCVAMFLISVSHILKQGCSKRGDTFNRTSSLAEYILVMNIDLNNMNEDLITW